MSLKEVSARAYAQDMRVDAAQEEVTRTHLVPAMPAILERLRVHREVVDRKYERLRKVAEADCGAEVVEPLLATYPVGFCRHIRDDVWALALADREFIALLTRGVVVRKVFILLKGQYFQNAVQLGNLYVDVANDTVWVYKPKLEWAPVEAVDYTNCETWSGFAEVARRYLKVELYPNRLFPVAFPAAPFLAIRPSGRIDLLFAQDLLFLKDLGEGMPRVRALLADDAIMSRRLPAVYEERLRRTFGGDSPAAFPLAFAPVGAEAMTDGVVREFRELGQQPPDRVIATIDRYLRVMVQATRQLTKLDLKNAEEATATPR